jgi:dTDP-4-dehydrorhamnose reductase
MHNDQLTLILGGEGRLGAAICSELNARGFTTCALSRRECNVNSTAAVAKAISRYAPATIVNCAALTGYDRCEYRADQANAVNGEGAGTVASFATLNRAKLVHISCAAVFSGSKPMPYTENDAVGAVSVYGRSKLFGERLVRALQPSNSLIVRTGWLFGGTDTYPARVLAEGAVKGRVAAVCDQVGSPSYVGDVAAGIVNLMEDDAEGVWHVANHGPATPYDIAQATLEQSGVNCRLEPVTTQKWMALSPGVALRPVFSVLDSTAYARRIGIPMRHWRLALAEHCSVIQLSAMAEN